MLEDVFGEEDNFLISGLEVEPPDEVTLWKEKIARAVPSDTGNADFTWRYVSPLPLHVDISFMQSLEMQGLALWSSTALALF